MIWALYLAFFLVWCAGTVIGEAWPGPEQPMLWDMPLWFLVGCVFSFIGVSAALIHYVRRWL